MSLSSCGGGGGGGRSGASSTTVTYGNPSWVSLISNTQADIYRTAEYSNQYGLEKIHAAEAYALLTTNSKSVAGDNIAIAIVDTGVQTNHVEIAANYQSSGSYDFVNSDSDPNDDQGHGTQVASITAGVKNGSGMHGVAYNSNIIAIKVLNSEGSATYQDVSEGISAAASTGAKVINLSLGGSSASSTLRNSLLTAKAADVLAIAATGNDATTQPDYPAYYASDSSLVGYVLAVGSVNSISEISSFSQQCGDAMNYCLVAPGENIYAAYTSDNYETGNGTSFATPHVSGAAAVIRGAWTFLTAAQTAQILLRTATDLGAEGVDVIYGRGLLNLYAAVQAQGQNTLGYGASVESGGYEISSSSMNTSAIFGDAFTSNVAPKLNSAIFFDDFGRDYKANLASKISIRSNNNLSAFNNAIFGNIVSKASPMQFGSRNQFNFNYSDYKTVGATGVKFVNIDNSKDPQASVNTGFSLVRNASDIASNLKLGFAFNTNEIANLDQKTFGNFGFISQNNFAINPYQSFLQSSLVNDQYSRKFNQFFAVQDLLNKKLSLRFSYQSSYNSSQILSKINQKQNQLLDFGTAYQIKDGSNILFSIGNLTEFNNNILNSQSVGAFESNGDVKTSYLKISFNQNLSKNLSIIGSFSEGISKINGNQVGIFREFNNVRSRSSAIALIHNDFFKGQAGIVYSEPLRVYQGNVKIDIPIARDYDGNLTRYQTIASLTPKGRERDLEFFYAKDLNDFSKLKFNLIRQSHAGNLKNVATNYLGFMQLLIIPNKLSLNSLFGMVARFELP
jgi:hypothetical protein